MLSLPNRLRVYAQLHAGVTLTLNKEQALLLADDIELALSIRLKDPDPEQDGDEDAVPGLA